MAKWVLPDETELVKISEAMKKYDMTLTEVLSAIKMYADDRDFQRALDEHYNNLIDPTMEYWSP
jgi:hypothetical protein